LSIDRIINSYMTIRLQALILLTVLLKAGIAYCQNESQPMSLSNRVAQAELIVVGKVSAPATESRFSNASEITVEQVLYGSVPTNRTLVVWFAATRLFVPGLTGSRTNRYICFLVRGAEHHDTPDTFEMLPVGPRRWAHNGFELATVQALDEVCKLIAERNTRK
jgi:hypothetical protein